MRFEGHHQVMAIANRVTTQPVFEYVDGKKTEKQKTNDAGQRLFSVRGMAPFVGGELVADGSVHALAPVTEREVKPGSLFPVQGVFTPRPAQGWGVTGTLVVESWTQQQGEGK